MQLPIPLQTLKVNRNEYIPLAKCFLLFLKKCVHLFNRVCPAGDTRGGMVIETPSPGPSSQSGIGGYSGIGASTIRTPQQHGRFISSTENSVYSENNISSPLLATGR
jgi:hypothetical protein